MKNQSGGIDSDVPREGIREIVALRLDRDRRQRVLGSDAGIRIRGESFVGVVVGDEGGRGHCGAGLADVEGVEQGAVVDGHGVVRAGDDAEGGCEGIGNMVCAGGDAEGEHACVRVWGEGLSDGV